MDVWFLQTMFVLCFLDDDSDTATEGEEEIRARELRKQEVRVEPPIVHTDTGTDTEVKPPSNHSLNPPELPDILSSHDGAKNEYSQNKDTKLENPLPNVTKTENPAPKPNLPLAKSATVGNLAPQKVQRNFVIPPKDQRKSFGKEFVPAFKNPDPTPLLIIKRTPSKINLPAEVGKPKVAVKTNIEGAKKYFGEAINKPSINKPCALPKPILKRSETAKNVPAKNKLVKQVSLPESDKKSFNFEPEETDLKSVDTYIEDLLANKDELMKPIDPKKYSIKPDSSDEEKVSSSIEDLLKALETETRVEKHEIVDKPDEKIDDLLSWMENLDHQTQDRKVYRSYSDVKYKNLERILKAPKRADTIISKIPKDNISYFERHMSGKGVPKEDTETNFSLSRSKTVSSISRSSVDLDAVTNVDIKKVLQKFEQQNQEEPSPKPPVTGLLDKRKSFSSFRYNPRHKFEAGQKNNLANSKSLSDIAKKIDKSNADTNKKLQVFKSSEAEDSVDKVADELNTILKDIESFMDNTIKKIGSAASLDKLEGSKSKSTSSKSSSSSSSSGSFSEDGLDAKEPSPQNAVHKVLDNLQNLSKVSDELLLGKTLGSERDPELSVIGGDKIQAEREVENKKRLLGNALDNLDTTQSLGKGHLEKNESFGRIPVSGSNPDTKSLKKFDIPEKVVGNLEKIPSKIEIKATSTAEKHVVDPPTIKNKALYSNVASGTGNSSLANSQNIPKPNYPTTDKTAEKVAKTAKTIESLQKLLRASEKDLEKAQSKNAEDQKLLTPKGSPNIQNSSSIESVSSFRTAVESSSPENSPDINRYKTNDNSMNYNATVSVTETRLFPNNQKNIEDLYAKVNKQNKKQNTLASPAVPQRNKKQQQIPVPQRPMRQKSFEGKADNVNKQSVVRNSQEGLRPVVPQRKRSTTASPQLKRKNTPPHIQSATSNNNNATASYNSQKSPKTPEAFYKNSRTKDKDKDKECCLQ